MAKKIEFETYKNLLGFYEVSNMKKEEPSAINFLSYKKYKVIIEEVEESKEVYIERLKKLSKEAGGWRIKSMIEDEIKNLSK